MQDRGLRVAARAPGRVRTDAAVSPSKRHHPRLACGLRRRRRERRL